MMTLQPVTKGSIVLERGEYRRIRMDGKITAKLGCPLCGVTGYLDQHEIARNGTVSPSVQCTNGGCSFHDEVVLEGWAP